jgi:arylsulfatase B
VNVVNADMSVANPSDPVSGFAGIPRNMTGIAAKLKSAGYNTGMMGKWDAGMATPDHTPLGRGYDRYVLSNWVTPGFCALRKFLCPDPLLTLSTPLSLLPALCALYARSSQIYFHHANDYWTQQDDTLCKTHPKKNNDSLPIVDLWATGGPANKLNNSWTCSQTNQAPGCKYEDEIFVEAVLDFIAAHDPTTPMFLFWAPHIVHAPLEVPQAFLDKFAYIDTEPRRFYAAMVNFVDTLIGRVVDALKAKGMWDNLLWVSSADNG